jgi:hypothetical protein
MPTFFTPQEGLILLKHCRGWLAAILLQSDACCNAFIIKPGLVAPVAARTHRAGLTTTHTSPFSSSIKGFMQGVNSPSRISGFTSSSTSLHMRDHSWVCL